MALKGHPSEQKTVC